MTISSSATGTPLPKVDLPFLVAIRPERSWLENSAGRHLPDRRDDLRRRVTSPTPRIVSKRSISYQPAYLSSDVGGEEVDLARTEVERYPLVDGPPEPGEPTNDRSAESFSGRLLPTRAALAHAVHLALGSRRGAHDLGAHDPLVPVRQPGSTSLGYGRMTRRRETWS